MADARVCIGVITAPHGVRGMVKIKPFTARPEDIAAYGPVTLDHGQQVKIVVKSIAKGLVLAQLDKVTDRETAETLKGCSLHVDRTMLPDPGEDEIYQHDLIGATVADHKTGPIGAVTGVYDFGAGEMLEVSRPGGKSVLIPFGGDRGITLEAGRITLDVDPVWLED